VNHTLTRCHPLNIAIAEAGTGAQGVVVIDIPFPSQRDRLKAPVRMLRKPWNFAPVVHPPTIAKLKIRPHISAH
jgi:hypothetical protein